MDWKQWKTNLKLLHYRTKMDKKKKIQLKEKIVRSIKTVYDPEIPVDVYELGLIYEIKILDDNNVHVLMTLTSPSCPAAESIPNDVKNRAAVITVNMLHLLGVLVIQFGI